MNQISHNASTYQHQLTFILPDDIVKQWDKDDAMAVIWQILDKLQLAQPSFKIDAIYYGYLRKTDENLAYGKCYDICEQDRAIPVRIYRQAFTPALISAIQPGTLFYWFEGFEIDSEGDKNAINYFQIYEQKWSEDDILQIENKTMDFLGGLLSHQDNSEKS
jgi:hypothetical protein